MKKVFGIALNTTNRMERSEMINWKTATPKVKDLYFKDVPVGTAFVNAGGYSQGAVYIKVMKESSFMDNSEYFMLELQTFKLWPATKSVIKVVELEINIPLEKPSIYD
jgi:hypothetical protein